MNKFCVPLGVAFGTALWRTLYYVALVLVLMFHKQTVVLFLVITLVKIVISQPVLSTPVASG